MNEEAPGRDLDLGATRKLASGFVRGGGTSRFDGGDAAKEILNVDEDGAWSWLQLTWKG